MLEQELQEVKTEAEQFKDKLAADVKKLEEEAKKLTPTPPVVE